MASAQVQLPHDLQAILKEEDSQIDASSEQPKDSIVCPQRKLTIYKGDDPSCWQWVTVGVQVEVAVLLGIDWLDVSGKFSAKNLTPGMVYQVSFVLMMTDWEYGFANHPVNFKLAISNCHETIERKEDLSKLPKNKWTEVGVKFITSRNMTEDLEISMFEHGPQWKGGLKIVDKIVIHPVRGPCQN